MAVLESFFAFVTLSAAAGSRFFSRYAPLRMTVIRNYFWKLLYLIPMCNQMVA